MRRILMILAFLVASLGCFAGDFRNASWLMTKDEVLASEGQRDASVQNLSGQQEIVLRSAVKGIPVTVTYILENDKLLSASYTFKKDLDFSAFNAMKSDLVASRGAPSFANASMLAWRLEKTEIALTHLPDGTTYVAYWQKAYFARMNGLANTGGPAGE